MTQHRLFSSGWTGDDRFGARCVCGTAVEGDSREDAHVLLDRHTADAAPPVDPKRAELVAALRDLVDLIASRPDLEIPDYNMTVRFVAPTRAGLDAWAAQLDATVRYQQHGGGQVIPYIDHLRAPLHFGVQSSAEPDPAVVDKDARIAALEAELAAARAQAMSGGESR